jgi:hypothetical protein
MKLKTFIYLIGITITIVACQTRNESLLDPKTKEAITKKQPIIYEKQGEYEKIIQSIDTAQVYSELKSLDYNNLQQSHSLRGIINSSKELVKLTHENILKEQQKNITTHFYFNKQKLICAIERVVINLNNKISVTETKSYYDNNEDVVFSCKRTADAEDAINSVYFSTTKKTAIPMNTAIDILQQKGLFETRFIGFIDQNYIIVGTNGANGYNSALMLRDEENKIINLLMSEEKLFANKLLRVEFSEVKLQNGFIAQGLDNIEILEK